MNRFILFIIVALVMLQPSEVDAESQRPFIKKLETGMSFCWKKKKGKYALVRKLKGYDDYYVTDYIYDVSKNGTKENLLVSSQVNFEHQWIVVERDNKFGIIDLRGVEVVPCIYDKITKGSKLTEEWYFSNVQHYSDKDSRVGSTYIGNNDIVIAKNQEGKKGIIQFNWEVKTILDFDYDYIFIPENNCKVNVEDAWRGNWFHEKFYFHNLPFDVGLKYRDAQYFIIIKGDKYGLYDRIENKIIEPNYDASSFRLGNYDKKDKHSGYYHHNYNGLYLKTPNEYFNNIGHDYVTLFFGKTILLKKDGKRVLYDMNNGREIVLDTVKNEAVLRAQRNLYYTYNNGIANGFVIDNGYEIEAKYDGDNIENFEPMPSDTAEIFKVKNLYNKKIVYGLYNAKLKKEILAPIYTKIQKSTVNDGFFLVEKDSTESYYAYLTSNKDSVILLTNKSDAYKGANITPISKTLSMVEKDGVYGLTDKGSGLLIPCVYDSIKIINSVVENIDDVYNDMFVSYYRGKIGLISPETTITLPYFTDIKYKADTITLSRNGIPFVKGEDSWRWKKYYAYETFPFTMEISIKDGNFVSHYNWDRYCSDFEFIEGYSLAVYIDYQPFLKALVYSVLHEREAKLLDEIATGNYASWTNGIDEELTSFAQMAYNHLDMKDELYEYLKSSSGTIANLKKEAKRMDELRLQQYEEKLREQQIIAEQARIERQQQWQNLAAALGDMANNVNAAINSGRAKKQTKTYTKRAGSNNYNSSSSSSQYTPTQVLEVWVPGPSSKATATHQFHNWYKRFYGNRWCIFRTKGGTFHTATTNTDTKCAHYDVSGYKYKAIDPGASLSAGRKYYYFN